MSPGPTVKSGRALSAVLQGCQGVLTTNASGGGATGRPRLAPLANLNSKVAASTSSCHIVHIVHTVHIIHIHTYACTTQCTPPMAMARMDNRPKVS